MDASTDKARAPAGAAERSEAGRGAESQRAAHRLLGWILKEVRWGPDSSVLDAGDRRVNVARVLAPMVRQVTVFEPAGAELGHRPDLADMPNVRIERGDPAALPYLDESFDLVISRLPDGSGTESEAHVRELVRVCRLGGSVAVMRSLPASHAPERWREASDPATRTASRDPAALLEEAGLAVVRRSEHEEPPEVEQRLKWSPAVSALTERIRMHFTQRWVMAVAEKRDDTPSPLGIA